MSEVIVTRGYVFDRFSGQTIPCLKSACPILNNMPLRGSSERVAVDPVAMIAEMNKVRTANGRPVIVLR